MSFFSNLFSKPSITTEEQNGESKAILLLEKINELELLLKEQPDNVVCRQDLLARYSEATAVFSQVPSYRYRVNDALNRINELRDAARRNF